MLPFDSGAFDTVVTTWTLCTIPDVLAALRDMRRVLRPDGRLLFVEHGLSPDASVARWQNHLTPCWRCLGGGCHLNRKIDDLISAGGFDIERLVTGYILAKVKARQTVEGARTMLLMRKSQCDGEPEPKMASSVPRGKRRS